MTTNVLVTGGTGTLGRHVVPLLGGARVLSRQPHDDGDGVTHVVGDLLAGTGVDAAVAGVDTVVHLAGGPRRDDVATGNLVRAAVQAGVRHLVLISVIGADRVPLGYFRAKHGAEQAVAGSGIPFTILRAAQFHDLALTTVRALTRLPVVPVPSGMRWQPVDARDVAARIVELARGGPAGRVPDLAGPTVYPMGELIRGWLRATARHRLLMPVRVPGATGRAYRAGDNLAAAVHAGRSWEAYLEERCG